MVSFYCKSCRLDQKLPAEECRNSFGAWFKARCERCKRKLIRFITKPHLDPYFHESKRVLQDRYRFQKDLIQPGEYGFRTLYPKEWAKFVKAEEVWNLEQEKKKKDRDAFYNENKLYNRTLAKKVIEAEEKIGKL